MTDPSFQPLVHRLAWKEEELDRISFPKDCMVIRAGFGSGLARRGGDSTDTVWAVGDRGPNLKVEAAIERYGMAHLESFAGKKGAKIMPRPDLGPTLAELRVTGDRVELVRTLRISDRDGRPVSGLPLPQSADAVHEPALACDGTVLPCDGSGLDTEGIAALSDGGFWVGDEFGPSLVRLDEAGRVLRRLVPQGTKLAGDSYAVEDVLPALASKRQLNRGFEAIAVSTDERWLFLAFQSPLAHPDEAAHEKARHVRLWQIDSSTGEVVAQYLYPLDAPHTFLRDRAKAPLEHKDLKVSELLSLGEGMFLVLERGSETTKIYRVELSLPDRLGPEHLDAATRPTVEELSARGEGFPGPVLKKRLVFNTDDAPEVAADLEGMVLLAPAVLLLVNDNDFGVEGVETSFWRITFDRPVSETP